MAVQAMAGSLGGMASMAVTYPLYTITMQMQAKLDTYGGGSCPGESFEPVHTGAGNESAKSQITHDIGVQHKGQGLHTPPKKRTIGVKSRGGMALLRTVVLRILRREGFWGLFKGLKAALIANGLQSAVYYYFYAIFKRLHNVAGKHIPLWVRYSAHCAIGTLLNYMEYLNIQWKLIVQLMNESAFFA